MVSRAEGSSSCRPCPHPFAAAWVDQGNADSLVGRADGNLPILQLPTAKPTLFTVAMFVSLVDQVANTGHVARYTVRVSAEGTLIAFHIRPAADAQK